MSDENSKDVSASERDRCLSIMADQQIQFDKFRENVNGRLTNLERTRCGLWILIEREGYQMATYRCPVHDVLFDAEKPPTHMGHKKCPHCNPSAAPKPSESASNKPADDDK